MDRIDRLAADVATAFSAVHRRAFLGDPAANGRLTVAVVDARLVEDTPVLVMVTPWSVLGLVFAAADFPDSIELAGRRQPVFRMQMPDLPPLRSIVLAPQAAAMRDMAQARKLARSWAEPLAAAIQVALVRA